MYVCTSKYRCSSRGMLIRSLSSACVHWKVGGRLVCATFESARTVIDVTVTRFLTSMPYEETAR